MFLLPPAGRYGNCHELANRYRTGSPDGRLCIQSVDKRLTLAFLMTFMNNAG